MLFEATIPGTPVGQARPRFFRRGNHVGTYNPQQNEVATFWLQCREKVSSSGSLPVFKPGAPLTITLTFYFPRPKGHYGTGKNAGLLKPSAPKHHTQKPDCDNCIKFVKDALKPLWGDDCQVFRVMATKMWAGSPENACTKICVEQFGG